MLFKRIQLGLIHTAVAITLVPIQGTLNRVVIKELAIPATLLAIFASLPYLLSPIQVLLGSFADRRPLFGMRRTPYIAVGLLFCVIGVTLSPQAAFLLAESGPAGVVYSVLIFGAWGMGFNFATVSYFSLASEISGPKGRSRTIAFMFFMMILGIIFTSTLLGRLLDPYTEAALYSSFSIVGGIALIMGFLGLVGLEERNTISAFPDEERHSWGDMFQEIFSNPQAKKFFIYLILLLAAILGQDLLLEPFGAELGLSVSETTLITRIWGISFLLSLVTAGMLENKVSKLVIARIGAWGAILSFILITISGAQANLNVFYIGVVALGLATGLATVSNLSLMLDMTTAGNIGLFIGAWGMASAIARGFGNLLNGVMRDIVTAATNNFIIGYQFVFVIEALILVISLLILRGIDVKVFKQRANEESISVLEAAAIAGDV
jgi:BCD family chlorophyll transporter-like MFS transporter